MTCGYMLNLEGLGPIDRAGCRLPRGHAGRHEFEDDRGCVYQWEVDLECDCEHCMEFEGDYCTLYDQIQLDPQPALQVKVGIQEKD